MKYDIIIIDDEEIILTLLKRLVIKSQIHSDPITLQYGMDAINFLKENDLGNKPKIIMLDINMPRMDGWDFLDLLSQHNFKSPIHVLVITSSINVADKEKAAEYEKVVGYFEKPVTIESILTIKSIDTLSRYFV